MYVLAWCFHCAHNPVSVQPTQHAVLSVPSPDDFGAWIFRRDSVRECQHWPFVVVSVLICTDTYAATYNPFNFGENWVGTFNFTFPTVRGITYTGSATLQVTQIDGLSVQLLGTFNHGQFCDPTRGCRTPGVSQYYLTGTVNGQQLVATPTAWAAITDTSFPPQSINGFISVSGQNTLFTGAFGSGSINTTLACSASNGLVFESGLFLF